MADYDQAQRGALRLKGSASSGIKKKKKKSKDPKKILEQVSTGTDSGGEDARGRKVDRRTRAEMAYDKVKEKRAEQQILEKASMTHKERILKFNEQLDDMSEHYDIPKVSWTK